jgi:DNA repair protein RadC
VTETAHHPVYRITDLQVSDRPRERLAALGAQALANAELLAILLRVGCRERMLCKSVSACW